MKGERAYKLIIGLATAVACCPLRVLYILSDVLYVLCYYVVRYRRRVVRGNLEKAFPELTAKERKRTEKRFYRNFCDNIVETIKLLHISDEELRRRVEVVDAALVERTAADGRPVILFLGHYGNWEWVQFVTTAYRRPAINGQIYRPLADPVMERVILKVRSRFDTLNIPQKRAFRTLLALSRDKKQYLIGFIADQRPNSSNMHYWTTFLGLRTPYNVGGEEIGRRIDAHYMYLDVERTGRGRYRMTFKGMGTVDETADYPYARRFMELMENTIRRDPSGWLWSHNRWKY